MPNGTSLISGVVLFNPIFLFRILMTKSIFPFFCGYVEAYRLMGPYLGLNYSVIDMRLDGGLGDIVTGEKNLPVPGAGQTCEMLSGTRHHNNHDAWIVVRTCTTGNNYLSYFITSAGLDTVPVVSPSLVPANSLWSDAR